MIKVDLITGFLGSGKTTFIKEYAQYLIDSGLNIGILENDFGAVNVDMMLLSHLEGSNCDLEMIAGGCDKDCHIRRFKTKLIAMGMLGYDRVIIEPSGIFDVDEFFDILHDEPIDRWYETGSVIAVVDGGLGLHCNLSEKSRYMLASQLSCAGCVILSRAQELSAETIDSTKDYIKVVMGEFGCETGGDSGKDDRTKFRCADDAQKIVIKDWSKLEPADYETIMAAGYTAPYMEKLWFDEKDHFQSLYYMNTDHTPSMLEKIAGELFGKMKSLDDGIIETTCPYGNVIRIKGFLQLDDDSWLEVNATRDGIKFSPISEGQKVIIVIGEGLNEEKINSCFE